MTELLAAVPPQAWVAGLLAAAIGGLGAALARCPDDEPADVDEHGPMTDVDLLDISRWDEEITPGIRVRGTRNRREEM